MRTGGTVSHESSQAAGPYTSRVMERGRVCLHRLGREIEEADPGGSVPHGSRLLRAGLAELAMRILDELGPRDTEDAVADLAASLSLLTKIDDEVMDGFTFHGGKATDRRTLREKTTVFLDETLRSIETGVPRSLEPRCVLAARVGLRARALAASARSYSALLELLRQGWQTQVDAVVGFTTDAREADLAEIDRVTRRVSGDWLALMAACGTLPSGSHLSHEEVEAIRDAGAFIQRADALADLEKDQLEGLTSTWAACAVEREADASSPPAIYRSAATLALERRAAPSVAAFAKIRRRLKRFSYLLPLLEWVRQMLLSRYRAHALYASPVAESLLKGAAARGGR